MTDLLHFVPFIALNCLWLAVIETQRRRAKMLQTISKLYFRKQGRLQVL